MPQSIDVGTVLGGRYRITDHVVTSADQDVVFTGLDQVLNRRVTILVASLETATQVASSARELATGERDDDVQVLDLGLSEGHTYLIAGGDPDPDALLGLAYPQETFVEPFQTDTLGSEIFGSSRDAEAQEYDDDEVYYTELDARLQADQEQHSRRPGFLNRLSDRLSERVNASSDGSAAREAAGASALAAAGSAAAAKDEEKRKAEEAEAARRQEAEEAARRETEQAEQDRRAEQERRRQDAAEDSPAAAPDAQDAPRRVRPAPRRALTTPPAAAAAAPAAASGRPAGGAAPKPEAGRKADAPRDPAPRKDTRRRVGPWLVAALLCLLLAAVVVVGFLLLNNNRGAVAEDVAAPSSSSSETSAGAADPSPAQEDAAPATLVDVYREVPDNPPLESQHDAALSKMIDGDPQTLWQSYAYTRPNFGGYARTMNFVVRLDQPQEVSTVTLDSPAGQGGAVAVGLAGDQELSDLRRGGEGVFQDGTATIDITDEQGQVQYVVVTVTALPELNPSGQYRYGLQIGEITVD